MSVKNLSDSALLAAHIEAVITLSLAADALKAGCQTGNLRLVLECEKLAATAEKELSEITAEQTRRRGLSGPLN